MFKVGDWVQAINNPEIVFQIEEFHCNGIVIHDGLFIEERFLKPYNQSVCPICGKPEMEEDKQPQPGTHIITVIYECGSKLDYPLGSNEFIISKRCDELHDSWFPEIDYVDHKLESIINDRYDEHYHVVDNTTGHCVTCGENVDKIQNQKLIFNKDYYGEDLNDISRDITWVFSTTDDKSLNDIPNEHGIMKGKFNVTITWSEE